MFFPERVTNISSKDRVLEVGPGGGPHPRSDVFLEMAFPDETEEVMQRSGVPKMVTDKPVYYYDGDRFPFSDNEFDYVICSHVLEHVVDCEAFVAELQRVAGKGYLEFPTIYYDYIYNMPTHLNLLMMKNNVIYYLPKNKTSLNEFAPVQAFFYKSLDMRYTTIVKEFKEYFFQGFEWSEKITILKANSVADVSYDPEQLVMSPRAKKKRGLIGLIDRLAGKNRVMQV